MSFKTYPHLKFPKGSNLARVKAAFDYACACNVVESISEDGTLVIDQGNLAHSHLWEGLFRELTNRGVVWVSLRHEDEDDEFNDNGCFLYSLTPQEGHFEVRYADPRLKMVWNRNTQIHEWV